MTIYIIGHLLVLELVLVQLLVAASSDSGASHSNCGKLSGHNESIQRYKGARDQTCSTQADGKSRTVALQHVLACYRTSSTKQGGTCLRPLRYK